MVILRVVICLAVMVGSVMACMYIGQPLLALACGVGSIAGIVLKMKRG